MSFVTFYSFYPEELNSASYVNSKIYSVCLTCNKCLVIALLRCDPSNEVSPNKSHSKTKLLVSPSQPSFDNIILLQDIQQYNI